MSTIEQYSKLMNDKFFNNQPIDIMVDSFILGFMEGKRQQNTIDKFNSNLAIVDSLRQLIYIQVYDNQKVLNIYNQIIISNADFEKLCQQLEQETFEGGNQNQADQVKIPQQQIKPAESIYVNQNFPQNSYMYQQNSQQRQQKSIIKVSNQQSIIKQIKDQQKPQQNSNYQQNQFYPNLVDYEKVKNPLAQASQIYLSMTNSKDLRSLELAKQLQQQFDSEEAQRLAMQQSLALKNIKIWCSICLELITYDQIATLYCTHIYHHQCLNQYCLTQIKDRKFPIICPSVACKKSIIYPDLIEVLDNNSLDLFQQYTFKHFVESRKDEYSWCPTPDCQYVFVADGKFVLECPLCAKTYCLKCKVDYHIGLSCELYIQKVNKEKKLKNEKLLDDQFLSFVNGAKFKQCPQCKFWVEKSEGCNHMTCRCKFQFCYVCGGVYQKCACIQGNPLLRR